MEIIILGCYALHPVTRDRLHTRGRCSAMTVGLHSLDCCLPETEGHARPWQYTVWNEACTVDWTRTNSIVPRKKGEGRPNHLPRPSPPPPWLQPYHGDGCHGDAPRPVSTGGGGGLSPPEKFKPPLAGADPGFRRGVRTFRRGGFVQEFQERIQIVAGSWANQQAKKNCRQP